jgi:hypothetical protein
MIILTGIKAIYIVSHSPPPTQRTATHNALAHACAAKKHPGGYRRKFWLGEFWLFTGRLWKLTFWENRTIVRFSFKENQKENRFSSEENPKENRFSSEENRVPSRKTFEKNEKMVVEGSPAGSCEGLHSMMAWYRAWGWAYLA